MRRRHKPNVFISYRRSDSRGHAGRLFDFLTARLGRDHVFMDIDSIPAGRAFFDVITETIAKTDVLIVLIGRTWLSATDETGQYRIEAPHDYVRREIEAALARGAKVMPVLVDSAEMPPEVVLPESLKPLAAINALSLPERGWVEAASELLDTLQSTRRRSRRGYVQQRSYAPAIAAGIVMVLTVAGAAYAVNKRDHGSKTADTRPVATHTPTTKRSRPHGTPSTTATNPSPGTQPAPPNDPTNTLPPIATGPPEPLPPGVGPTPQPTTQITTSKSTLPTGTVPQTPHTSPPGTSQPPPPTTPHRIKVVVNLARLNAKSPTPVTYINVRQRPSISAGPPSNYIPTDCVTQCLIARDGDPFYAECYMTGVADWPHGSGYYNYVRIWLLGYMVTSTQDYGYLPEAAFPDISNIPACTS